MSNTSAIPVPLRNRRNSSVCGLSNKSNKPKNISRPKRPITSSKKGKPPKINPPQPSPAMLIDELVI